MGKFCFGPSIYILDSYVKVKSGVCKFFLSSKGNSKAKRHFRIILPLQKRKKKSSVLRILQGDQEQYKDIRKELWQKSSVKPQRNRVEFIISNRPLSNFAKTKEQSRGWEDKFAISYVQRKMQICPLNVDYVLLFLSYTIRKWPIGLVVFLISLSDWNTTFGKSLLWEPFYEVVSFGPPASSLSSVVPFSSGFIAGKNSTS